MKKCKPSHIYLGIVLLIMYLPVLVVIGFSFNNSKLSTVWSGFSLMWYEKLFQNTVLLDTLKNSLILGIASCGISAVIGTAGAVGMARSKFLLKGAVESVSLIPIMIPEIILGMAFLSFFSMLGMRFGMMTLIIAHCAFCVPYIFMMVKGALAGIDPAIPDAARDLGASDLRAFWDITLPLITPAILSGSFLAFAMSLDDVVISFFVTGPETNTLPVKIYSQLKMGVTPEINALCTVMLAVTFFVVILSGLFRKKAN